MTRLHQIQIQYAPAEDRGLLRVNTTDGAEYRFWLTRRFVVLLWPLLVRALDTDGHAATQRGATERAAVRAFEHHKAVGDSNFATPFQPGSATPLGGAPVLLGRAALHPVAAGGYLLSLHPLQGQGIDLTFDGTMLHSFSKLLDDMVRSAEWQLDHEALAPRETLPPTTSVN